MTSEGQGADSAVDVALEPVKTARRKSSGPARAFESYAVVALTVLTILGFSLFVPTFRTVANFQAMVNSESIVVLLALIACIPLRTGDLDFSIASTMVVSAAITVKMTLGGTPTLAAVAVAILAGVVVGLIQGFIIVRIRTEAIVVSLGMQTALVGVAYAITSQNTLSGLPNSLIQLSRHSFFGIQASVWYGWILVLVLYYVFEVTPLGRYMLFVGGNNDAARLAGLRVDRIRIGALLVCSTLAAVIGILLAGQLGAIDPTIGPQYLLPPFAAVFLGATTIKVGRFNAFGTLVAAYFLAAGITGLQLLGAPQWVSYVFNGGALIISVVLARLAGRRAAAL